MKFFFLTIFLLIQFFAFSQQEDKNWYFGTGTDGIIFNNSLPVKVSNKFTGVGYEGMVVVSDPLAGNLLFYSDGIKVIDKNHLLMTNGNGLTGNLSGSQCVQCCPVPGTCMQQYYLFTNSAYDNASGAISFSIIDFTLNPLGTVTNKNTPFWSGPSDEGMCLVSKKNSNNYWLIANTFLTATYNVWEISSSGISAPVVYSFSNSGSSYQINYSEKAQKLVITGWGNKHVTTIDFDASTGVMSNEVQLAPPNFGNCFGARFSPDGSKLYVGVNPPSTNLHQYDFNTNAWQNMNTCCYAHDVKMGPDGKMYFIHTYSSAQPIGVIDFPDSTAIGNLCNYHTLNFTPSFNGQVRRFPEFITLPDPPIANADTFTVTVGLGINLNVMVNDLDPQSDTLLLDSILYGPLFGSAAISGTQLFYTADSSFCGMTDTIIYRIKDINCSFDTTLVIIHIECNQTLVALASSDTSFCEKQCIDFFDLSTNNPISWQWFFPGADSTTSILQNPTNICYNMYGSFDVTLIACNAIDCDTLLMQNFISEFQNPVAVITQSNDTLISSTGVSYQWFSIGNGLIAGATNNYFVPIVVGNYFVIVSDSNGCESSSNVISITTGLNSSHSQMAMGISITPNPFTSSISISFANQNVKQSSICVKNILGQIVFTNIQQLKTDSFTFDLSFLRIGIYFLEVNVDGDRMVAKILKQ